MAATRRRASWFLAAGSLAAIAAVALCALLSPVTVSAAPNPATVFQCQKAFKHNAGKRAACIQRAKAKPGSSCAKPLYSGMAVDGATIEGSDTKDAAVNVRQLPLRNPGSTEPMGLQLDVEVHSAHVEICRAVIVTYPPELPTTTGPLPKTEHVLSIPKGGGSSRTVVVPANYSYGGIVYLRRSAPGATTAATLLAATPAQSAAPQAHQAGCIHLGETEPKSPCRDGNVEVTCSFACTFSKSLHCRISKVEGTPVNHGTTTEFENAHQTVRCSGPAELLKVYIIKGKHSPFTYVAVRRHGKHSLLLKVYAKSNYLSVVILALK